METKTETYKFVGLSDLHISEEEENLLFTIEGGGHYYCPEGEEVAILVYIGKIASQIGEKNPQKRWPELYSSQEVILVDLTK